MSMIFNANLPDDTPQTHALIIGVNDYYYLRGGSQSALHTAPFTFDLNALTAAVPSAVAVAEWLLTHHKNPNANIGTVSLLLSPNSFSPSNASADRLGVAYGTAIPTAEATFANIETASREWIRRGNWHRDNIMMLYFCGHGLEASDRYLLPADYGVDSYNAFSTLINITETRVNMSRCRAKTQCFFIDACRQRPERLREAAARATVGRALIGELPGTDVDRDAPLFHGAARGQKAFGVTNGLGHFTRALLECLNGMGGQHCGTDGSWSVDTNSLAIALRATMARQDIKVECTSECTLPEPVEIHYAAGPVPVLASVRCNPKAAHQAAELWIEDSTGRKFSRPPAPNDPKCLWELTLRSGDCTVGATFEPNQLWESKQWSDHARPPLFNPRLEVG